MQGVLNFLTMSMEKTRFSETPVTINQPTRRQIPEELNLHKHGCEKLTKQKKISFNKN
jgi:hypothetical protein